MSFILDALKKSEAERQLGEIPSLASAGEIRYTHKQKRSWLLPLILFLIVVVALAWFWRETIVKEAGKQVVTTVPEAVPQTTESQLQLYPPSADLPRAESKQTPLANYTPPVSVEVLTDGVETPDAGEVIAINDLNTNNPRDPSSEQAESGVTVSQADQSSNNVTELQRMERLKQQRVAERAEDEALVAAVEQRLAKEAQLEVSDKPPAAEPSKSNSVRLNELPSSVRKNIPDISISMQVYSADPVSRFAIINGKRYAESDSIAQDLILEEILRQGVILQYRKYRILFD